MDYQGNLNSINSDFSNIAILINETIKSVIDQYRRLPRIIQIRTKHEELRRILGARPNFTYSLDELRELQTSIKDGDFSTKYTSYMTNITNTFITNGNINYQLSENNFTDVLRTNLSSIANNREHLTKPIISKSKVQMNIDRFIEIINREVNNLREREGNNGNLKRIFEYIFGAIQLFIFNIEDDIRFYKGKDRIFTESLRAWFFIGFISRIFRGGRSYATTARELTSIKNYFIEPMKNTPLIYINSFENISIVQTELNTAITAFKEIEITEENIQRCRGMIMNIDRNLVSLYRCLLINEE